MTSISPNADDPKMAVINGALARDPANIALLIAKADYMCEKGNGRLAIPFYRAALRGAAGRALPAQVTNDLERARAFCDRYAREYEKYIYGKLAPLGVTPEDKSRFAQSLDLMFGRKTIYHQQPSVFYYPELAQTQFFERAQFPWIDEVEAATDAIRAELIDVMKQYGAFVPYIESDPSRPPRDYQGLANSLNWGAFYLFKNGEGVAENIARCPATMHALQSAPLDRIGGRTPTIMFSMLRPKTRIPPHNGFLNTRLICHLPLIVPPGCGFRVGNDTRSWVEGKAWVFDDTIEHEAWNSSDQPRAILLFDIWRPDLSDGEKKLVTALLEAVASFDDSLPEWTA
jgi:aspartate beta-hydroxylase